jgi:hypothetical protein
MIIPVADIVGEAVAAEEEASAQVELVVATV